MSRGRNLDKARRLTAGDAEALLLALGSSLEWGDGVHFVEHLSPEARDVQCFTAGVDAGFYCVYARKGKAVSWLAAWQSVNPDAIKDDFCPDSFDTATEAKAACERHHATGIWK